MQEKMKLIICPNDFKMNYLASICQNSELIPIKFMTKEEFFQNYFFSYDDSTLFYLMNKYHYHIDVCKTYLNHLFVIDLNQEYQNEKLQFLQKLKRELIQEKLLIFNPFFQDFLKDKEIIVEHYYDLDFYEEKILHTKIDYPLTSIEKNVYEFYTQEEEINYVCIEIRKLLDQGVPLHKIFICNVSSESYYLIHKMFSYYHIPINLDPKESIYGTKMVQNYLNGEEFSFESSSDPVIEKQLISVLGDLVFLDSNSPLYSILLKDKLKHTYFPFPKQKNAVQIGNLYERDFQDDEYVFVIGMNQDVFPKMEKDIQFITDAMKKELDMYDVNYLNRRLKNTTSYLLSKIKNLRMSYSLSSPFASFYRSSFIDECGISIIREYQDTYEYSDLYNKIRLGEKLDTFYLYGTKEEALDTLSAHYDIPYHTYQNDFTGISHDTYLTHLPYPLKLSYTSLNTYNECKFKYYVKYVLKLDSFLDTFQTFVGSLYHKILSLYKQKNFHFEEEYQKYLENRELSLKEKLLLIRIKKDLLELLDVLKKQELITGYDDAYYEVKMEVDLEKDVSTKFIGYIDKILYYKNIEDTYFSIIDYKTGTIDTHIEPMKYGLHMQLPVYLYLIHYSKYIDNPIFTGIYYQNILFPYPKWDENVEKSIRERYYLQGYSTDKVEVLERFDSTYQNSEYIKSMKYSDEKGFSSHTKLISDDTLYEMLKYTKKFISKKADEILDGDFSINPKIYDGHNVSCEFCSFKDLCFMREKDCVYYDKVNDLSFLGGEE